MRARAKSASPKGRKRQRRKRSGDGRVALGGVRIRKTSGRCTTHRERREKLLNKKRTAILATEGAAEIARTTQKENAIPEEEEKTHLKVGPLNEGT